LKALADGEDENSGPSPQPEPFIFNPPTNRNNHFAHAADAFTDPESQMRIKSLTIVDKFAPAEKSEPQPQFKKTTDSVGKKQ
jgi:hypothetical protein